MIFEAYVNHFNIQYSIGHTLYYKLSFHFDMDSKIKLIHLVIFHLTLM